MLRNVSLNEINWLPQKVKKRQEAIDELFISENGGINLCHSYIRVRGIREGGFRLARHSKDYDGPTALEIISWGVGIFRENKTEQDTSYVKVTGETPLPKINSNYLKTIQHHLIPTEDYETDDNGDYTEEIVKSVKRFESTNLILADSYGELEQLRSRTEDKDFLKKYLKQLRRTTEFVQYPNLDFEAPKGILEASPKLTNAWTEHIKNGLWANPPESIDELLERISFLLENTLVDENPKEVVTDYKYHAPMLD